MIVKNNFTQNFTHIQIPPLMSLTVFCKAFCISKSLFYKLPIDSRPRTVRVGTKPMVRAEDALDWAAKLPEA